MSEEFNESQKKLLEHFVTNTQSDVFVLRNLPEVIKGALFSRYSRSSLGLKALLLKEFIQNEETAFDEIVGAFEKKDREQIVATQKAQNFYDRILDGYGDDSIGELGGAHLALENISMLAAKEVEDRRIGGSPLEKSTRYIYFDQKMNGEYLYYKEPTLMASAYKDIYLSTCNELFETYSALVPLVSEMFETIYPKEKHVSEGPYKSALRAKVCDVLRGLLPAGTLTNMGVFGNGRFYEGLLQKMNRSSLGEIQEISKSAYGELSKVIPSFVRRSAPEHKHQEAYSEFMETMEQELKYVSDECLTPVQKDTQSGVRLIDFDPDAEKKVAKALLFATNQHSLEELGTLCDGFKEEDLANVFEAAMNARKNRRHKSPRALEQAQFTFEIVADFGCYRDLQRHRMLSQERQVLGTDLDYYMPSELVGTKMEMPYRKAMEKAKKAHKLIAKDLPAEAQYVVPMAYNLRWYFTLNLRALQWLCELRSGAAGHIGYRLVAQDMAKLVSKQFPSFERFFGFMDYEGYELGRLGQEIRTHEKAHAKAKN